MSNHSVRLECMNNPLSAIMSKRYRLSERQLTSFILSYVNMLHLFLDALMKLFSKHEYVCVCERESCCHYGLCYPVSICVILYFTLFPVKEVCVFISLMRSFLSTWTILFVYSFPIHGNKADINPLVNSLSCFSSTFPLISHSISLTHTQTYTHCCFTVRVRTYFC